MLVQFLSKILLSWKRGSVYTVVFTAVGKKNYAQLWSSQMGPKWPKGVERPKTPFDLKIPDLCNIIYEWSLNTNFKAFSIFPSEGSLWVGTKLDAVFFRPCSHAAIFKRKQSPQRSFHYELAIPWKRLHFLLLFLSLSVCLSVCLFVYLPACLSVSFH